MVRQDGRRVAGRARPAAVSGAVVAGVIALVVGLVGFGPAAARPDVRPVVPSIGGLFDPSPSAAPAENADAAAGATHEDATDTAHPADPAATAPDAPAERAADPGRGAPTRLGAAVPAADPSARSEAPTTYPNGVAGTPCTATARACVDVVGRKAWLMDGGTVVRGPVQVQTGDQEDPTPLGTFSVQWKAEQYTSREYLVQMPYSVFFAPGGVAFHQGRQDTPSAGCVKLLEADAKAFFTHLQVGDEVQVT
ncbi:L,D-transpeptidase [Pseudonocardia sp. RS11V-5]|uniref:L,D-transpeptidase n=1 Tax=Pseudonocardia terrae TaxID=2905831 RepID=UPI001E39403E|nr:L,D-transpeptidase [Pseudonocardia terrae]MCE3550086.1 L,D-transpeptidase [Pseudonocardia terrae]